MTEMDTPAHMTAWHTITAEQACEELSVDATSGFDAAEVERRREQFGANRLDEPSKEPGWQAFLRQYRDLMQLASGSATRSSF
jgi:Ca2+-transporting ATPase